MSVTVSPAEGLPVVLFMTTPVIGVAAKAGRAEHSEAKAKLRRIC
jgi:hypothetical protein